MSAWSIDNYDSFTYNLVQYLGELGAELEVVRNDEADGRRAARGAGTSAVIVSPGPVHARRGGHLDRGDQAFRRATARRCSASASAIRRWRGAFGGKVVRGEPVHGKTAEVEHDGRTIFRGLESPVVAGRYHSLVVDPEPARRAEVSARSRRRP